MLQPIVYLFYGVDFYKNFAIVHIDQYLIHQQDYYYYHHLVDFHHDYYYYNDFQSYYHTILLF